QAEDGIRDDLVTGVQTCALPISAGRATCRAASARRIRRAATYLCRSAMLRRPQYPAASEPLARVSATPTRPFGVTAIECADPERSEERRGGNGSTSGASAAGSGK